MSVWYLDTSGFVKLVGVEEHSDALREWLIARDPAERVVSSDLLRTEATRAARRTGDADALQRTAATLEDVALIRLTPEVFGDAAFVDPPWLRSLDAIHIAAAQALGRDLGGIVAYGLRLVDAARALGIATVSPGVDR